MEEEQLQEQEPLKFIILCHGDVINNIDSQGRKIDWNKNPSKYSREYFQMFDNMHVHFFSNHGFCERYNLEFAESICSAPGLIGSVETIEPNEMCYNYKLQRHNEQDIIYRCVGQNTSPFGLISNDLYNTLASLYNDRETHVYCLFCRGDNQNFQSEENYGFEGNEIIDVDNLMQMEMMGGRSKKKTKKRKIKKYKHLKIKKSKTRNKRKNNKK
jgi:hypothetical protein